jgi:hypothetical protein
MENSIKEDIKILENFINWLKIDFEYDSGEEIKAIEHILSDYKRVLKENEELKKFIIEGITIESNSPYKNYQLDFLRKNFIPIQKVKDKIEELKKKVEELTDDKGYWGGSDLLEQIKVLQELLEKEQ